MSNSKNSLCNSALKNKSEYTSLTYLISSNAPKTIQNSAEDHEHQNEVIQRETQDCFESYKLVNDHPCNQSGSSCNQSIPSDTVISNLASLSKSTYSGNKKSINHMKKEEQRMETEMESMKHGEERMKYEIKLMKYRENRMENEIELMKRHEKSVDEATLVRSPIFNQELSMNKEIERMKTYEKHITCEIERMEHYETRLIDEIRSIENEIKYKQYFPTSDIFLELAKHQTKLSEHSKEVQKRKIKLDESCTKRIEYEDNLYLIRKKIEQERQRENYHIELLQCRAKSLRLEIDLLKQAVERMKGELQVIKNSEERREHLIL